MIPQVVSRRARAQATVEAAMVLVALALLLALVVSAAWWGHAQGVLNAAVQDGARAASARDGDTARGVAIARELVRVGLGPSANGVEVQAQDDAVSVTFTARGQWPLLTGPGIDVAFPLSAEARVRKERWQP